MQQILCIDTTTEACSVALGCAKENVAPRVYSRYKVAPRKHAELVLEMVDEVLQQANLNLTQLDAIGVTVGPGAFTGVRLGIAVAQGLAFSADLKLIPIGTLDSLAFAAVEKYLQTQPKADDLSIAVAIDARMNEVYWGCFDYRGGELKAQQNSIVTSIKDIEFSSLEITADWLFAGTGWSAYANNFQQCMDFELEIENILELPDAVFALSLIQSQLTSQQNMAISAELIEPLYLRDKVAETTIERLRKKSREKGSR